MELNFISQLDPEASTAEFTHSWARRIELCNNFKVFAFAQHLHLSLLVSALSHVYFLEKH